MANRCDYNQLPGSPVDVKLSQTANKNGVGECKTMLNCHTIVVG